MDTELSSLHWGRAVSSLAKIEQIVVPVFVGLILIVLLWRFAYPSTIYLSFFTDDFFYYAVVAKNLVRSGMSTFNGLHLTNGYHPLWLATIALLYWLSSALTQRTLPFFIAVVILIWILIVGTYRALRATQIAFGFKEGSNAWICALVSAVFMTVLSRTGMEVSLALFFLSLFWRRMGITALEDQGPRQALASGLLASCAVLSRLDCLLAVAFYLALTSASLRRPTATVKPFIFFGAGLTPIPIYVLSNLLIFNTLLPISGMAKNLMPLGHPSGTTLARLLRFDTFNALFTWPSFALGVLFIVFGLQARREKKFANNSRNRVLLCVLLHPVLFYTTLSFTSDWPVWTWYLYPLVPIIALLGPEVLSRISWTPSAPLRPAIAGFVLLLYACILAGTVRINPIAMELYSSALKVQHFAASHPGRYAMGDRSGTPAWLMDQPIVQMEGLMEDRPFLDRIKHRENLISALQELHVDYYVSAGAVSDGSCFSFREPVWAGSRSPVMQGHSCSPSLETFGEQYVTRIFDVHSFAAGQ